MTTNSQELSKLMQQQIESCQELMHEYYQNLEPYEKLLQQYSQMSEQEQLEIYRPYDRVQTGIVGRFMWKFYELYLTLRNNPILMETKELQDFIQESALYIRWMIQYICRFQRRIESLLLENSVIPPAECLVTPEMCQRRSAIEALRELYQDIPDPELTACFASEDFDSEDVDILLGTPWRREPFQEDEIPTNIPPSHWWWWGAQEEAEVA
jgi:hypothetical protein